MMKKKIVNFLLWVAVPVISLGKFYCIGIGDSDIAIIGRRTGLPAVWDRKNIMKNWYRVKVLKQWEDETERM